MAIIIDHRDIERARQEKENQNPFRADRLTAFLYNLVRDCLTFGDIEQLVENLGDDNIFLLTNKRQAEYAEELKKRILSADPD